MDAESPQRDAIRAELQAAMMPRYRRMREYNFRQLHFHLPDTTSFLRMHRPGRYGDYLGSIRHTVRIANAEERIVTGFEEGRIYNGYRYIFPVRYEDRHVGTVEASYSMEYLLQSLERLTESRFAFVMERSVVGASVFGAERTGNYRTSSFSDRLLFDAHIQVDPICEEILSTHRHTISPNLTTRGDFGLFLNVDDTACFENGGASNEVLVQFRSIRNIADEHVAYLIGITQDDTRYRLRRHLFSTIAAVTVAAIVIVLLWGSLQRDRAALHVLARTDQLTGILNRRSLLEALEREIERVHRYGGAVGIIMLDIDLFKSFNDRFGHAVGDQVLSSVASGIRSVIRATDIVSRWGGEEFLVVLPDTSGDNATAAAEKIRWAMTKDAVVGRGDLTVSVGVTEYSRTAQFKQTTATNTEVIDAIIECADGALYRAKARGRNTVCRG